MIFSIFDRAGLLSEELHGLAERRVLYALSRFESRISTVDVVVNDENGPRGGIDKVCRITVRIRRGSAIVITDRDAQWAVCISRAVERAGRSVARAIERGQQFDRSSLASASMAAAQSR